MPREALNVMYLGMNNTIKPFDNEKVRQAIAMGIDRKRIVDNFYPPGSTVADYFTPCSIPFTCGGTAYPAFDAAAAKKLLSDAGFPDGFSTKISFRDVVRSYISNVTGVAQDIQAQLKTNLNIDAAIDVQESGTFIDNSNAGKLPGLFILGWGADFPDQTNFMDYHFGLGHRQEVRHAVPGPRRRHHEGRPDGRRRRPAGRVRPGQHPACPAHSGRGDCPRRFRRGVQGRCRGRAGLPARG